MNSPVSSIKTKPHDKDNSSNEMTTFSALKALASISSASPSVNDVNDEAKKVDEGKQSEKTGTSNEKALTFPLKLMAILSNEEHAKIIAWLPHGKSFCIYNKKEFAESVLPRYFKKSKFTSFTRKLHRWQFVRIPKGPKLSAYHHNFFQRDNAALCMEMTCLPQLKPPKRETMQPPFFHPSPLLSTLASTQMPPGMTASNMLSAPPLINTMTQSQLSRRNLMYQNQAMQLQQYDNLLDSLNHEQESTQHNMQLQSLLESSLRVSRQQDMIQQELRRLMASRSNAIIASAMQTLPRNNVDTIETKRIFNHDLPKSEDAMAIQDQIKWLDMKIAKLRDNRLQQIANCERRRRMNEKRKPEMIIKRASAA